MEMTKEICVRRGFMVMMAAMLAFGVYQVAPFAFAESVAANEAIDAIVLVLKLITGVVGVIYVLLGLVRIAMAHANEDGPGQQKAAVFMATGIVLILFGTVVLDTIDPKSWLTF